MQWLTRRYKGTLGSLERITKTDLTYLGSGGFWLTIDQVAGGLIAFLLIIGFARFVSPEAYGTYRYLLAALWTLAAFTLTGLPTALSQAVARGYEGVYRKSFWLSIAGSTPLALIGLGTSVYYFLADNSVLGYGFLIIALLGPFMQQAFLFGAYLTGKKDFRMMALLGAVLAFFPAVGLGIAMFFTQDPLVFFFIYLAGNVLAGSAFYILTLVLYRPNHTISTDFRALTGHFSLINLLSTVAGQIDKLVVFHYLGAVELAIYSIAIAMPEQVRGVFSAVSTLALPKFAKRTVPEIRENFWNRLWSFTGVLGIASLLYILIAPYAFQIFLPTYMSAVVYSQVFALSLIMTSAAVPTALLQAHAAKRELYVLNIVSPIFQIIILILLTMFYGLIGTIIARIVARSFTLLMSAFLVRSYFFRKRDVTQS